MKTTNPTTTAAPEDILPSIDAVTLDDVTGGCAACGQNCATGPAPAAAGATRAGLFGALGALGGLGAFGRR